MLGAGAAAGLGLAGPGDDDDDEEDDDEDDEVDEDQEVAAAVAAVAAGGGAVGEGVEASGSRRPSDQPSSPPGLTTERNSFLVAFYHKKGCMDLLFLMNKRKLKH